MHLLKKMEYGCYWGTFVFELYIILFVYILILSGLINKVTHNPLVIKLGNFCHAFIIIQMDMFST